MSAQGVPDALRLLHDLLQHEVGVAALLDLLEVPFQRRDQLVHVLDLEIGDLVPVALHHRHLAVIQIDHLAGVLQQGRGVRGHEVLTLAQPDQERRAEPCRHQGVRLRGGDHRDPVRTLDVIQRGGDGLDQGAVEELLDQVGQHLGVRIRPELVSLLSEPLPEGVGVLDDAVVDDRQRTATVDVRVGVVVVGDAVRRPARVRQADRALGQALTEVRLQVGDAPRHLLHHEQPVLDDGEARRVVPSVLEALHAVQ
jgi:hypothetical protein